MCRCCTVLCSRGVLKRESGHCFILNFSGGVEGAESSSSLSSAVSTLGSGAPVFVNINVEHYFLQAHALADIAYIGV